MEKEPITVKNEEYFQQKLEAQKQEVLRQLKEIAVPENSNPGVWQAVSSDQASELFSTGDNAEMLENLGERQELVDSLAKRLGEIHRAEERIREGKGGICAVCGQPIEENRREADPASITCKEHRDMDDTVDIS